ncbi:MAG: hypothetical protein FJ316_13020 [SAR202 cluster bacterium]|nr:hypothetical protein [SAR202 cluster bacterium]
MTKLLQEAFDKILALPDEEQDAVAAWLLEELATELRWDQLFQSSSDVLARLADEALAEQSRGWTQP